MYSTDQIVQLMKVPAADHDLPWLKESLQAAIQLEFATIPPYLSARWSIKSGVDPAARAIRDIVREEMLHMGIVSNLLAGIGGHPLLNTPEVIPTYPGPLPGGVNPSLIIPLQGLSREAAKLFMEIEFPEEGPVALAADEAFPTIGAFYSAIEETFDALQPALAGDLQREGPLGLTKILTIEEAKQSIQLIKRQGEGSINSPEDTGPSDLAHYYRFGEIFHGKRLVMDPSTGQYRFDGAPVPFPDVWPMAVVPIGGYKQADVTAEVWTLLEQFDTSFTTMVNQLQEAWSTSGDQGDEALSNAVGTMFELRGPAVALMQIPVSPGVDTYGPCFRLI